MRYGCAATFFAVMKNGGEGGINVIHFIHHFQFLAELDFRFALEPEDSHPSRFCIWERWKPGVAP